MPRKKSTKKTTKKNFLSQYTKDREDFFKKHPNAKMLIAIFIIAFVFFIGKQYKNLKAEEFIEWAKYEADLDSQVEALQTP